jgi:hypothetical protein
MIRTAFKQDGELSAGIELRRLFPGITDGARPKEMARVTPGGRRRPSVSYRRLQGRKRDGQR